MIVQNENGEAFDNAEPGAWFCSWCEVWGRDDEWHDHCLEVARDLDPIEAWSHRDTGRTYPQCP